MNTNTIRLVIVLILSPTPILLYWWLRARRRKRERMGLIDTAAQNRARRKAEINELAPRVLIARFVGGFGSLFLAAGLYAVINNLADWKTAVKAAAFGVPLLAFAASLIKDEATPLAVHLNRALFVVYALLFIGMLWHSRHDKMKPAFLIILRLVIAALLLAAIGAIACTFSRARITRWVLVVVQAVIANFWLLIILRSKGPALWGHPVAVGTWAAITFLLVISLFWKGSNVYYAIQAPQQTNAPELNQNQA